MRGSSRIASWKTRGGGRRRKAIAAAFLCLALRAGCQSVDIAVGRTDGVVTADVLFRWAREAELISTLRDGLESHITFTVRLSTVKPALLPFLGETLVIEKSVSRSAYFDMLEQRFAMESDTGVRTEFEKPEELVREFFSLRALPLGRPAGPGKPSVSVRVQFEAVRLMPPLGIVMLAGAAASYTSPWVRKGPEGK